ncbi:MAG: AMP-binding protein, partial [Fibrobacter sp.]|nr:AMP-binding protein [Fibrobacter sp.]
MLLGDTLTHTTEKYPDKTAIVNMNREITYSQLYKNALSLANGLISENIHRGDRVAIYLENSIESVISIYGALKSDGVFLVINPHVKHKKLSFILNDCGVKF